MNVAKQFLAAFPHASKTNGWSPRNLEQLVTDAARFRLSEDEVDQSLKDLLRKPRRSSTPSYAETFNALQARFQIRTSTQPDGTTRRLRQIRTEHVPPTPEQKARQRAWLAAFKSGDKSEMHRLNQQGATA